MDIERELETLINEHKGKQVGLGEILDRFAEDCLKEIRRKAEIARQSVTSEEVQRAIELLSGKSYGTHNLSCDCVYCKAIDLAITALQAYQPTISKTEITSCEWCDSGIDTASVMSADMMMRFVRPVNYCPNCGRRLED